MSTLSQVLAEKMENEGLLNDPVFYNIWRLPNLTSFNLIYQRNKWEIIEKKIFEPMSQYV